MPQPLDPAVQALIERTPRVPFGLPDSPPPAAEVFLFGQVGYASFLASDTFNAIFGAPGLPAFGAGAHVNFAGRWFVDGSFDWIQKTGERVAVSNGQAFPLGISDRVRMVPLAVSGGYRFRGRSVTTYVGGGAGALFYQETSDFADPSENVSDTFSRRPARP